MSRIVTPQDIGRLAKWNIDRVPTTPSPWDDEFDGPLNKAAWTNIDTGATMTADADSTVKSHLYLASTGMASTHTIGFYKPAPPMPFTVTAKLSSWTHDLTANHFIGSGVIVGEAVPGKFVYSQMDVQFSQSIEPQFSLWTNPTTFSANLNTTGKGDGWAVLREWWVRIVVRSSTDMDGYFSLDGVLFTPSKLAYNPGFTVGSIGLVTHVHTDSLPGAAAFDWIRVKLNALNPHLP